jgi:hypothetical protein
VLSDLASRLVLIPTTTAIARTTTAMARIIPAPIIRRPPTTEPRSMPVPRAETPWATACSGSTRMIRGRELISATTATAIHVRKRTDYDIFRQSINNKAIELGADRRLAPLCEASARRVTASASIPRSDSKIKEPSPASSVYSLIPIKWPGRRSCTGKRG